MFKALLGGGMREGKEEEVEIQDVRAPVFRALLQFAYTDSLPEACRKREPHGTDLTVACCGQAWLSVAGVLNALCAVQTVSLL